MDSIESVSMNFQVKEKLVSYILLNDGLINNTFLLKYSKGRSYILQKINTNIFSHPKKIMSNIQRVSNHLIKKRQQSLEIILTKDNEMTYVDNGNYWRMYKYIQKGKTLKEVSSSKQCYSLGLAIGLFHKSLEDFPVRKLDVILSDFHNTQRVYDDFLAAIKKNSNNRIITAKHEITFLKSRKDKYGIIQNLIENEKIPIRVCHNDTKFSNILLNKDTEQPIALIDLDTLMPHTILFDFGDAVRALSAGHNENETNLKKVNFNIRFFESFTKGFLKNLSNMLSTIEIKHLAFSCLLITLEQAMRFLTDFLEGDIYYKTSSSQNLKRARNQIHLAKQMEKNMREMEEIICKFS